MSWNEIGQPLFLKPLHFPGEILFSKFIPSINKTISFRSFDLEKEVELIHFWVNEPYALPYWQLPGPKQRIFDLYYSIQRNSNAHSYIGLLDGSPICQFDVYRILADEVKQYIMADFDDCGFHLLMAPNRMPIPGLSFHICSTFLEYYFSFPEATRMFAEPDIHNIRSNALLKRLNFNFIESIQLSYKIANLYSLTKNQFIASQVR